MITSWPRLFLRSLAVGGWRQTLRKIPEFLGRQRSLRRFDRRYNTRTSDVRPIDLEEVIGGDARHSSTHMPTPQEHFDQMVASLPVSRDELVFVDVGSGMGRVVLYASTLGFKRVIGVEFSRRLHEVAVRNVQVFRRAHPEMLPVELVCADALTLELPRQDTLLYFHQPFDRETFERFMEHLARSLEAAPRSVLLVYYEPRHETAIQESGLVELLVARGEPGDPSGAWRIWRTLPAVERRPPKA